MLLWPLAWRNAAWRAAGLSKSGWRVERAPLGDCLWRLSQSSTWRVSSAPALDLALGAWSTIVGPGTRPVLEEVS